MTSPDQTSPPAAAPKMGFATASAAAITMLLALFLTSEKRIYVAYFDVFGVLTVCGGVTGPGVVQGKTYTDAECDTLERNYVAHMLDRMARCVARTDLTLHQVIAWSHFAYNIGFNAFCGSTAAKYLNSHRDPEACDQMLRWVWGTDRKTGKRIDCSLKANRCGGLPDRRQRERRMCLGDLDAFKP